MAILIKKGYNPKVVAVIQDKLNAWLAKEGADTMALKLDGDYGPKTEEVVKLFQTAHGLKADGVIGPITFDAISPPVPYEAPKRGKVEPNRQKDKVERALLCVGSPVIYHLEYPNGGTDPEAPMPCDENTSGCDCSGFDAWVQGHDRLFLKGMSKTLDSLTDPKAKGSWANTDSKIAAALAGDPLFSIIPLAEAEPGDMIIGHTFRTLLGKKVIGHEGTIVAVHDTATLGLAGLAVVHCSPSNVKKNPQGSAVWKTDGTIWKNYKVKHVVRFNADVAYRKYLDLTAH